MFQICSGREVFYLKITVNLGILKLLKNKIINRDLKDTVKRRFSREWGWGGYGKLLVP